MTISQEITVAKRETHGKLTSAKPVNRSNPKNVVVLSYAIIFLFLREPQLAGGIRFFAYTKNGMKAVFAILAYFTIKSSFFYRKVRKGSKENVQFASV